MEYIIYIARTDGAVVSFPVDDRPTAAEVVSSLMAMHVANGGHGNVVTETEDDVLIVMAGIDNEPVVSFIAAPVGRDFIEVMQEYISPELNADNFNFISIDDVGDPNITIN